jgi:orotidine-5'-phosphate decarboxylase
MIPSFYSFYHERAKKVKTLFGLGLDPEIGKIPNTYPDSTDTLFEFSKQILESTEPYIAFTKINIAFFERYGSLGFSALEKLIEFQKEKFKDLPIVLDCKRGDLDNTAKEYAKYYFQTLKVHTVTLSPYMGSDTIRPFLELGNVFLLCLTSNPSGSELQRLETNQGVSVYLKVSEMAERLNNEYPGRVGIVVGGTQKESILEIRKSHPDLLFLLPGFGAQGGDSESAYKMSGLNSLFVASRAVLYPEGDNLDRKKSMEQAKIYSKLFPYP